MAVLGQTRHSDTFEGQASARRIIFDMLNIILPMNEVKRLLKRIPLNIWWILASCFLLICLLPIIFTQLPCVIDFSGTGQIGDTIGGIM